MSTFNVRGTVLVIRDRTVIKISLISALLCYNGEEHSVNTSNEYIKYIIQHMIGAIGQNKEKEKKLCCGVGMKEIQFAILSNVIWQGVTDTMRFEQTPEKHKRE